MLASLKCCPDSACFAQALLLPSQTALQPHIDTQQRQVGLIDEVTLPLFVFSLFAWLVNAAGSLTFLQVIVFFTTARQTQVCTQG
jgi:hypothetical protein